MAKKDSKYWRAKLAELKGAKPEPRNPHETVIQTASPSFNFIWGRGWGLPLGYSANFYGEPKSGKSLLTYILAGGVHSSYPDGIVVKFNTEFREEAQLTPEWAKMYGIDWDRYMGIDANSPMVIYDQIDKEIRAWCKEGMPIKLIIIDSMNGVQGLRTMETESIEKVQIGDVAKTNKEGLKRVLEIQREFGIAMAMTSHVAIEMDSLEQKRNGKYKNGASIGVQHHNEYFVYVERSRNKADRADILGREFVDNSALSIDGTTKDTLAHKIYFEMKDSSMGPKNRNGELTFDYGRGIINQHEEVFKLGVGRGIVERPTASAYVFKDTKWVGKEAFLNALKESPEMQEAIIKELRVRDLAGQQVAYDAQTAAAASAD